MNLSGNMSPSFRWKLSRHIWRCRLGHCVLFSPEAPCSTYLITIISPSFRVSLLSIFTSTSLIIWKKKTQILYHVTLLSTSLRRLECNIFTYINRCTAIAILAKGNIQTKYILNILNMDRKWKLVVLIFLIAGDWRLLYFVFIHIENQNIRDMLE